MRFLVLLMLAVCAWPVAAQDRAFTLQVPGALQQSGVVDHIVPRFALKHGIRITVTPDAGDAAFGADGTPVFREGDTVWHFSSAGGPHTQAFLDWLQSDVGKRTIEGFAPDGTARYSADVSTRQAAKAATPEGDAVLGEALSLKLCGRCHVVSAKNRMNAIGSSPSFGLMRTFPDWEERFLAFFVLKPHPAFTQVEGLTQPFPDHLPSPIAPIEVTLDEIDAITAFVASIAPADLGAPIQSQ